MGGGLNSSLGVFAFSLSQPLAPGASTNVQFVLGVQQSGTFRFFINVEAIANSLPSAMAGGPYSGPTGSPIQFNGSSSYDLEGPVDSYQWNFGDNTFGSGPAPAHTYNTAGTYTVTLTVTDNAGLTTTGMTTATIYPATNKVPVANIAGPYSAITGKSTQFSASGSFDPDGSITQYRWDFAGLGTGTGATPSFTFTRTGTHLVSLTVTDNVGAKNLTSINVTVSARQQAATRQSAGSRTYQTGTRLIGAVWMIPQMIAAIWQTRPPAITISKLLLRYCHCPDEA